MLKVRRRNENEYMAIDYDCDIGNGAGKQGNATPSVIDAIVKEGSLCHFCIVPSHSSCKASMSHCAQVLERVLRIFRC